MNHDYIVSEGMPAPLGPTVTKRGINFAIFSAHASVVMVCLFSKTGKREIAQVSLTSKTGDIWHGCVEGLEAGQLYGYRVDGPYAPQEGHRFNPNKLLIDPYAKNLAGEFILDDALYGFDINSPEKDLSFDIRDSAPFMPKCVVGEAEFDWGDQALPETNWENTIIYECHIKGFTKLHPDVPAKKRGTAEGLSSPAMIQHLKSLGVSAVEILPLQSFFSEPRLLEMGLTNYWGYNPVNYFAPHNAYLGPAKSKSIQNMVQALHAAGIEVILDVVYNHTAESWELGPTLSYRGIDNKSYYHLKEDPRFYENYTGCGNALNMANPAVLDLTLASLRYWVETYHIDGFRFDLGPTMGRNPTNFDRDAAFFRMLKNDPVLSAVKLIAEPWDIGPGGYQLGSFPNGWSEWNDQYRDTIRSYWRGDEGAHRDLAGRLLGSASNFDHDERSAFSSVNLISAHDGFTLHDTVSYNDKHNYFNGEENRDGHGHNLSDNMGIEGPADNPEINRKRRRRKLNMLATLLLSQGVPMLLAGDEFGQSQSGNNNAYCQDNETTWLNWAECDKKLQAAVTEIVHLRQSFPHFRQSQFLHGEKLEGTFAKNAAWINSAGNTMTPSDWDQSASRNFGLLLSLKDEGSVLVIINRGNSCEFTLPVSDDWNIEFCTGTAELNSLTCLVPAEAITVISTAKLALPGDVAKTVLDEEAKAAGIIPEFWDISGHHHITTDASKAAILNSMKGSFHDKVEKASHINSNRVYGADALRKQGGIWGLTTSLYGLQSQRNWGVGDFEDLANLAELMSEQGADFIGINPVHALFPSAPNLFAPYSPSSRDFLNVMHIAPDKMAELTHEDLERFESELNKARTEKFVDYDAVYKQKMYAFEIAFKRFEQLNSNHARQKSFDSFLKNEGETLTLQATFDAIFETLPDKQKTYDGYRNFPKDLQSPNSHAVKIFSRLNADRVRFYAFLQWIAHDQLSQAQSRAKDAGMSVGLYLDYAVGAVPGGADAWRNDDAFAMGISLGAPGDAANPEGQIWNLLPFDPHKLAANDFEPYRSSLRRVMRHAGAVRIDHILGHMRSFWTAHIDNSNKINGAYVTYPLEGLLGMIAEESQASKCVVIGEDLGTVPDGLRHEMHRHDLMGCGVVTIERGSNGELISLKHMRELSLTAFSNHDFPTLAGFWEGTDFEWRAALGISSDENVLRGERERRHHDKLSLINQVSERGLENLEFSVDLASKLHDALARSPALAVAVQLEDLLMQKAQPNVPGTTREQPNWRRKYVVPIDEIIDCPSAKAILSAMKEARPRARG